MCVRQERVSRGGEKLAVSPLRQVISCLHMWSVICTDTLAVFEAGTSKAPTCRQAISAKITTTSYHHHHTPDFAAAPTASTRPGLRTLAAAQSTVPSCRARARSYTRALCPSTGLSASSTPTCCSHCAASRHSSCCPDMAAGANAARASGCRAGTLYRQKKETGSHVPPAGKLPHLWERLWQLDGGRPPQPEGACPVRHPRYRRRAARDGIPSVAQRRVGRPQRRQSCNGKVKARERGRWGGGSR